MNVAALPLSPHTLLLAAKFDGRGKGRVSGSSVHTLGSGAVPMHALAAVD